MIVISLSKNVNRLKISYSETFVARPYEIDFKHNTAEHLRATSAVTHDVNVVDHNLSVINRYLLRPLR